MLYRRNHHRYDDVDFLILYVIFVFGFRGWYDLGVSKPDVTEETRTIMREEMVAIHTALTTFASHEWIGIFTDSLFKPYGNTKPNHVSAALCNATTTCFS